MTAMMDYHGYYLQGSVGLFRAALLAVPLYAAYSILGSWYDAVYRVRHLLLNTLPVTSCCRDCSWCYALQSSMKLCHLRGNNPTLP